MRAFHRLSVTVLALCLCSALAAQEKSAANATWDFGVFASAQTGEELTNSFSEAHIATAGFFAGRTLKHNIGGSWRQGAIQYAFSVSPLFLQVGPQRVHGIAFEPVIFRWNSSHRLGRATPYVELAGGAVHTNVNFPAGDTSSFNFTAKGGGGVYLPIKNKTALDVSVLWSHISNANLGVENPEFNGIELRVGYHWFR